MKMGKEKKKEQLEMLLVAQLVSSFFFLISRNFTEPLTQIKDP